MRGRQPEKDLPIAKTASIPVKSRSKEFGSTDLQGFPQLLFPAQTEFVLLFADLLKEWEHDYS